MDSIELRLALVKIIHHSSLSAKDVVETAKIYEDFIKVTPPSKGGRPRKSG